MYEMNKETSITTVFTIFVLLVLILLLPLLTFSSLQNEHDRNVIAAMNHQIVSAMMIQKEQSQ